MMPARSLCAALIAAPLLASCIGQEIPPDTTADGNARIAQRLAGRVAGAPVDCLPHYNSGEMEVIDRDTILFGSGRLIYRQDANGYCYPSGRQSGYILVTNNVATGGRLCSGEIARIVDSSGGFTVGSCSFNDFVPYRRP